MKVAGVFIILLVLCLAIMPFAMKGDGTLSGRIQTFISYGTSITAILLGLVTIFLATGIIASDVRDKQIFTVATKPLPRWKYIIGRWLGIVMLDAMLLAFSSLAIFGLSQYLRSGDALNNEDRRKVETEVFAARKRLSPEPMEKEVKKRTAARIKKLKEQGQFDSVFEDYKTAAKGDMDYARGLLIQELTKQISKEIQSAGPGKTLKWTFSAIEVKGEQLPAAGNIIRLNRDRGLMRVSAERKVVGKLIYGGPVSINGIEGKVRNLDVDYFDAEFSSEKMQSPSLVGVAEGKKVEVLVEPTIQLSYKAAAAGRVPDNILKSAWQIVGQRAYSTLTRDDPENLPVTLTLSSRLIGPDGKLSVTYGNLAPTSVTILTEDIAVLYRVGNFEMNFFKAVLLMLIQLMFLAGIAVLAGSFLSFPVACLVCFGVLPFSIAREFISDAVSYSDWGFGVQGVLANYIVKLMNIILPDFSSTSPGGYLVDGMIISWDHLASTAVLTLAVRTLIVLLVACIIFQKRELARVQV